MLYDPLWRWCSIVACYFWWYKTIERCDVALLYDILWQVWWTSCIQVQQFAAYRQCCGGGWRVAGSAMLLQLISGSCWIVVLCTAAHWTSHCWWPERGWTHSWPSREASLPAAASIQMWRDRRQPSQQIWGRCTRWHSAVCEIIWFETACTNKQSVRHAYCYLDWWIFNQRHATSLLIPQQIR